MEVAQAKFVFKIKGQAELPVRSLRGTPMPIEHVEGFVNHADQKERA